MSREPPGCYQPSRCPSSRAANQGQDDASTSLPPDPRLAVVTGSRGSNQSGAPHRRTNSGRFPICAGPALVCPTADAAGPGLSLGSRLGAGSLGQVPPIAGRPNASPICSSSGFLPFRSSRLGFLKGISSDHRAFVETRKGAPTNWAGTPSADDVDLQARFAKGNLGKFTPTITPFLPKINVRPQSRTGWESRPLLLAPWWRKSPPG